MNNRRQINPFWHLLRWNFILLQRNKIIAISVVVTLLYWAVFRWMQGMGNIDKLLLLVIFNDPALLGFLFIGVMVLFEKNENTLQALSVSPMTAQSYLWAKSIALTLLSLVCCLGMVIAVKGLDFNMIHFISATVLTTLFFSFLGFMLIAGADNFNTYMLRSVGVLVLLAMPFLGYFEVLPDLFFVWCPSQPAIYLYRAALEPAASAGVGGWGYGGMLLWVAGSYRLALAAFRKHFQS